MARFDDQGRQIPDPRPVEVPVEFQRPLSLQEEIKRYVRQELGRRAADAGAESFEESDDFDVGDDPDVAPGTEYELDDMLFDGWPGGDVSGPVKTANPASPASPAKPDNAAPEDKGGGASAPA